MQRSWADIEDTPPDNSQEHFAATPNIFDHTPPPTQAEPSGLTQPLADVDLGTQEQPPPVGTEAEDAGRLDAWLEELRQSGRLAPGGPPPQPQPAASADWTPHGLGPRAHAAAAATPKKKAGATRRGRSRSSSKRQSQRQEEPAEQQQRQPQRQPQRQAQQQQHQHRQHPQHRHQGPRQQQEEPQHLNENDGDWANRQVKRNNGVSAIKNTPEYAQAQLVRAAEPDFPLTPDPEDRGVSKRQWEASMQDWRSMLRRIAGAPEEAIAAP